MDDEEGLVEEIDDEYDSEEEDVDEADDGSEGVRAWSGEARKWEHCCCWHCHALHSLLLVLCVSGEH